MTQMDFVEFTDLEVLVNSAPFYFGGSIKHDQQQAAVLGMIRLHQMNGIKKKFKKRRLNDLVDLLIKDLSTRYKKYYCQELNITTRIRESLKELIKKGIKLSSNYDTLVTELALYKTTFVVDLLDIDRFYAYAKRKGVELPADKDRFRDPIDVIVACPDFSSNLFTAVKNEIKAWPKKIEMLLDLP